MFDVLVQLSVAMKECILIWACLDLFSFVYCIIKCCLHSLASGGDLLHEHEDFINSCDVCLNLGDVMLQDRCFDAFCTFESLHDSSVLVADISLNHSLDSLDFV